MTEPTNRAVFLSYASQNAEAARRICEALRTAGVEVWLDKSELRGGDSWDAKIRKQIKACALFVPIISANTQARTEGYFRLEWRLADQRTHLMGKSRPFIVPVSIDDTRDDHADVPDSFVAVQWTRLAAGIPDHAFCGRIMALLEGCDSPLPSTSVGADESIRVGQRAELYARSRRRPVTNFPKRKWLGAAVAAAIILLVIGAWQFRKHPLSAVAPPALNPTEKAVSKAGGVINSAPTTPRADEKSVAVLPFTNLSNDKENEHFSEAISDELINVLGRVPGLRVVARTSSFSFRGKSATSEEIGRALGVAHILEGSVQRAGEKARVIARLVHAGTGDLVWSGRYDQALTDIFAAQDEVAGAIARALSLQLGSATGPARDFDAAVFDLYARGRQSWNLRTAEGLQLAEDFFNQTITRDPRFVRGYIGLADVWHQRAQLDNAPPGDLEKITSMIGRALALEPDLAEAHASLGTVHALQAATLPQAERSLAKAVQLNPNYAYAHQALARVFEAMGKVRQALPHYQRAVALDPLTSRIADNHGRALLMAGRPDDALGEFDRAVRLQPDNFQAHSWRIFTLNELGRKAEAVAEARKFAPIDNQAAIMAYIVLKPAGLAAEAEALFQRIQMTQKSSVHLMLVLLLRGDDPLSRPLNPGIRPDNYALIYYLPAFDPIRRDPRFRRMISEVGLSDAFASAEAERAQWKSRKEPEGKTP